MIYFWKYHVFSTTTACCSISIYRHYIKHLLTYLLTYRSTAKHTCYIRSTVNEIQYFSVFYQTRMWASAQPDGRPAEHRWRMVNIHSPTADIRRGTTVLNVLLTRKSCRTKKEVVIDVYLLNFIGEVVRRRYVRRLQCFLLVVLLFVAYGLRVTRCVTHVLLQQPVLGLNFTVTGLSWVESWELIRLKPVSYTHLTLPTIYSV